MDSKQPLQQITPGLAFRLVLAQLAVTVSLAAVLFIYGGDDAARTSAVSALAGGMIATVANGWFSLKVFGQTTDDVKVMVRSLYLGEANKLLMTAAMFAAAFVLIDPVNGFALIAVYFLVHMTPFVATVFMKNTTN